MADAVSHPFANGSAAAHHAASRSNSISQASEDSQTAQDFINSQLQLEADAREALPYQFDTCTRPLGPLRQLLFSCLTCNPPPASPSDPYTPAGVCYSCSISCHGEHTLVELFTKRNFVCDCGTTRLPATSPCTLRVSEQTGLKGHAHSEEPAEGNKYNHNFRNRFCGCGEEYDAHQERGTMFQCLGLGSVEDGGCGEDWWHPECIVGLPRNWYKKGQKNRPLQSPKETATVALNGHTDVYGPTSSLTEEESAPMLSATEAEPTQDTLTENPDVEITEAVEDDEPPLPPGFPEEDDFDAFICYKCTEAFPWIKRYAGTDGFLPPVFYKPTTDAHTDAEPETKPLEQAESAGNLPALDVAVTEPPSKKRKADEDPFESDATVAPLKRQKSSDEEALPSEAANSASNSLQPTHPDALPTRHSTLPPAPQGPLSLFLQLTFRSFLCHCASCFPLLTPHPQLLEEEVPYEPALSSSGSPTAAGGSVGTASLLDRGEAALSNVDRVRAIEGVMVYNHLRDKVKAFLQPFAESGRAVGAEDIKSYFEGLRGDAEGIRAAAGGASAGGSGEGEGGDGRREERGY
ncbi:hypothetical protein W97_03050 [Coniosporium apollinis CBS 100218]|uniref:UBR-type domain-containing protein n=1 Tax=Coniosporium apollinis (strain CBS 100218) TaxID=1168221 RepID=R7YPJ7_CONA1|nr:uncharacterized protein W97_03050 [Coniosporium apollinis CBS 100218]EON63822.1 hypothetical protein W97_03050 [Coniosporium apollinis CBS 100218]